ncbi:hypothetical protein KIN20_028179 [Parelaphostrongylus tenuis]|uniref:Uncharacterized protein n=1 Tax=Parelaphostrongylus tenuis TaxID=148309 RepID=A0AAD5WEF9_PARTN|nr:hypothetical protein KIN20_028179 [Parelaphostrongylus tenuis]
MHDRQSSEKASPYSSAAKQEGEQSSAPGQQHHQSATSPHVTTSGNSSNAGLPTESKFLHPRIMIPYVTIIQYVNAEIAKFNDVLEKRK